MNGESLPNVSQSLNLQYDLHLSLLELHFILFREPLCLFRITVMRVIYLPQIGENYLKISLQINCIFYQYANVFHILYDDLSHGYKLSKRRKFCRRSRESRQNEGISTALQM